MIKICTYFGKCGGCQYQNLSDKDYETLKKSAITKAFSFMRIPVNISEFIRIPTGTRRRACFAFNRGHLGFNMRKSHQIIDTDECLMLTKNLNAILLPLKKLVADLNGSGDAFLLDTPFGIDMHIKTGKERATLPQLEMLAKFGNENNVARLLFNGDPILEKVKLPFPPDVFLQPSVAGEKVLIDLILKNVGTEKKIVDLFCGSGTFTKPLLEKGFDVAGFDAEAQSVANLGTHGTVRDLFRNPLMPDELNAFEAALIDPPRAGAKAQVEQLALSNIPKIIMISCNPDTAARDAKTLIQTGEYRLDSLVAIDQFTYSDHIEIFAVFKKNNHI